METCVLEATRCLSYWSIELKGAIPVDQRVALANHAYGCDVCQEVCPWNAQPAAPDEPSSPWLPRPVFDGPTLAQLWRTPDADLRKALEDSAMSRAGVKRLPRNVAVCAGATRDPDALSALGDVHEATCSHPL